jgi:deoxyribodipyrimidine photo-lyase
MQFEVEYWQILKKIDSLDPVKYEKTRNFMNGAVSYLSPYFTHGVISHKMVADIVIKKFGKNASQKFVQELAWGEYFYRVWEAKNEAIFDDLKHPQQGVESSLISENILQAKTGTKAIDAGIVKLYETGYMHNHCRMWVASVVCNVAKTGWWEPAKWMYYYLLDGNLASNTLSWQWVAGSFSSKKYWANQENLNKYDPQNSQRGGFLDVKYEDFEGMSVPSVLENRIELNLQTELPKVKDLVLENKNGQDLWLYHPWMLDPELKFSNEVNPVKILILEPSHFNRFPISSKRMMFILDLALQIEGLQVFVGEIENLIEELKTKLGDVPKNVYSIKCPATNHWQESVELATKLKLQNREFIFPEVADYYPSFFKFWERCQRYY